MAFYKFLDSRHISSVLEKNTLLVSCLSHFRDLEAANGPWIGDRLEGATESTIPPKFVIEEGSKELELINNANLGLGMFQHFAKVENGGTIDLSGSRFVHAIPSLYIYSFAAGVFDELKEAFCLSSTDPYDACLLIRSPGLLMQAILNEGVIVELERPVCEVFSLGGIDIVTYGDVSNSIETSPAVPPSPFQKDAKFAAQREHRMVFQPNTEVAPKRLTICVPKLCEHFEVVMRP